jgi:hypothetical protein
MYSAAYSLKTGKTGKKMRMDGQWGSRANNKEKFNTLYTSYCTIESNFDLGTTTRAKSAQRDQKLMMLSKARGGVCKALWPIERKTQHGKAILKSKKTEISSSSYRNMSPTCQLVHEH